MRTVKTKGSGTHFFSDLILHYQVRLIFLTTNEKSNELVPPLFPPISLPQIAMDSNTQLVLYSYWQSSCSWRVRFALNLKGIAYEYRAVNLVKGEQFSPEFERLNPLHFVPVLVDGDVVVSDSYAILLYLEEKYPQKPFLPVDPQLRAVNLQAAAIISTSIQPLHMLSVLKYIEEKVGPEERASFTQSIIEKGFFALEKLLKDFSGVYATGEEVYMVFIGSFLMFFLKKKIFYFDCRTNFKIVSVHIYDIQISEFIYTSQNYFKYVLLFYEKGLFVGIVVENCQKIVVFLQESAHLGSFCDQLQHANNALL